MTSDSSDSDDSMGMLESPVSDTVDEDDKNNNKKSSNSVFSFKAQKFSKKNDEVVSSLHVRLTKRARRNNKPIECKLSQLNRKKKARNQRSKRDIESGSDSDSEIEEVDRSIKLKNNTNNEKKENSDRNKKKTVPTDQVAIEILSSDEFSPDIPPTSLKINTNKKSAYTTRLAAHKKERDSKNSTKKSKTETDDLSSDDDSDEEDLMGKPLPKNLPADALAAIRRSQQAKAHLAQAQLYTAQDLHVAVQETVGIVPPITRGTTIADNTSHRGKVTSILSTTTAIPLGNRLRFTCRCGHLMIKGQKIPTKKDSIDLNLTMRENERIAVLVEKFCKAHNLPNSAKVAMTFDGHRLDTKKTPKEYKMEDEDLIDVMAEVMDFLSGMSSITTTKQQPAVQRGGMRGIGTRTTRRSVRAASTVRRSSRSNPIDI